MLRPVDTGPAIVVCSTCRFSAASPDDANGVRGGSRLAAALRAVKASSDRYRAIDVQEMACLFACQDFCTVYLRAPGKIAYVLGRFSPDEGAARGILDYAMAYAASEDGQVPFERWPNEVKGHFITRTPPDGFLVE